MNKHGVQVYDMGFMNVVLGDGKTGVSCRVGETSFLPEMRFYNFKKDEPPHQCGDNVSRDNFDLDGNCVVLTFPNPNFIDRMKEGLDQIKDMFVVRAGDHVWFKQDCFVLDGGQFDEGDVAEVVSVVNLPGTDTPDLAYVISDKMYRKPLAVKYRYLEKLFQREV